MTTQFVAICEKDVDGNIIWEQVGLNLENERVVVVSPEKYIDNPPWQRIYEGFVRQVEYTLSIIEEQRWFMNTISRTKLNGKKE